MQSAAAMSDGAIPVAESSGILGSKARDTISGFEGVATGFAEYLTSCRRIELTPTVGTDGTLRDAKWFDAQRIEIIDGPRARPGFAPRRKPCVYPGCETVAEQCDVYCKAHQQQPRRAR